MGSDSITAFAESVTVDALETDPYPIYARLRREAPVCYLPAVRLWFVTRYDDVEFVGTHPELWPAPGGCRGGLRWVSPIGTQTRQVAVDTELGGVSLPRGAAVGSLVSSANRDETKFAEAGRFDIFRPRSANLAFGAGRHFCAGHTFSRAQVRIAIEVLIRRFPTLALDPARPPEFRGWEFRAPRRLDVLL